MKISNFRPRYMANRRGLTSVLSLRFGRDSQITDLSWDEVAPCVLVCHRPERHHLIGHGENTGHGENR
jgi:hypothetical protein